jgi:RNA polymerase sigma factor (TIGR02999 family)
MASRPDVTALLSEWGRGNSNALNELLPLVYAELRRVAARQLRGEKGLTMQPTALVHELYLRLVDQRHGDWRDRAHFFGVAAQVIRRILVDHARKRVSLLDRLPLADEAVIAAASSNLPEADRLQTTLNAGHCIGPYEITALLGAGAMGQVYRAHLRPGCRRR